MSRLLILLVPLTIAACSNKAVYENMQIHQRLECSKEPPLRYPECIERTEQSYEEYQREREEILER